MPTPRFVILHHRTAEGEHWDLMLEAGEVLTTWQLAADPTAAKSGSIPARRIGDHRKAYLEYEGPLSRNRGAVTRVDAGVYRLVRQDEARWEFELEGGRLTGGFALVQGPKTGNWQFVRTSPIGPARPRQNGELRMENGE